MSAAVEKMRAAGVHEAAVTTFEHYVGELRSGATGMLPETEIEPLGEVPDATGLPAHDATDALAATVVVKLNGGLGTSMGMTGPKGLLEVRDGHSFLDLAVRQVLALRDRFGVPLPLLLMHSFATREPSLAALAAHDELPVAGLPLDFLQNKVPKLDAESLEPVAWPAEPGLEWCPPGHGDLYTALAASGTLDTLLERGFRWAFVSNVDNVGAVVDPRILGWMAAEGIPFVMEALDRTPADRKGGHLALHGDRLVLREIAQTPEEDVGAFQDVARHRFFNTNNLWLDLEALRAALQARDGVLGLPLIVNRKTVDPADKASPAVVQLETAMGAAIAVFEGARAVRVPRERFAPAKTTNDLLVLRSDAWRVRDDWTFELAAPGGVPVVTLDDEHYKLVADFEARFPAGAPSLMDCTRLVVAGDVTFGAGVVVRGDVTVRGPRTIADGEVLAG